MKGSASPQLTDRRKCPRIPARLEVAYEDAHRQVFLVACDISEGGMYLYTSDPPREGAEAKILFELPTSPAMIRVSGIVTHRETGTSPGFGIRFSPGNMLMQDLEALRNFVTSEQAGSTSDSHIEGRGEKK